ncbi:hypothetical protein G9A89_015548 [Geosiphon pyriformis]|nr:hypothetical protein G9A89_015548 [Geosiphon pyriformis]
MAHCLVIYPITYANKGKEKLQTPAVTPQKIQPPTWKKTRVKSPTKPSYYYTPRSAINITATGMSTLHVTSTFGQFPFQSKQRKEDLLGPYSTYFKEFKSQLPMPSGLRSSLPQPDFRTASSWKVTDLGEEQEEEKEESEDQEFTYQNPIMENLEIETPNFQTQQNPTLENPEIKTPNFQMQYNQNNQNSNINNQQHLSSQPQQQPMAYTPIAKIEKFTGKKNDAQVLLNDVEKAIVTNGWNDTRAMQAIPYFLQNTANS